MISTLLPGTWYTHTHTWMCVTHTQKHTRTHAHTYTHTRAHTYRSLVHTWMFPGCVLAPPCAREQGIAADWCHTCPAEACKHDHVQKERDVTHICGTSVSSTLTPARRRVAHIQPPIQNTYIRTCICAYTCIYPCTYMYTCMCVCVHAYMHLYIYMDKSHVGWRRS